MTTRRDSGVSLRRLGVVSPALLRRLGVARSGEECLADVLAPAASRRGTAKIAEPVNWRYSIIASLLAILVCSGMKWVRGSRT